MALNKKVLMSIVLFTASTSAVVVHADTALTYSYTVPYQGAGTLTINNNGTAPVTLSQINFATSAIISGNPWGSLWAWGASITESNNIYTITEPTTGVTIAPNQSATLTYQASGAPLPLAMNAYSVTVKFAGSSTSSVVPIAGACVGSACNDPGAGKRIMGYYSDWDQYARKYNATDLPVNKINTVIYSFIGYDQQGNISLLDPNADDKQLPAIMQLRLQHPYLHAALSFGGWTLSSNFSVLAANETARKNFATNAVAAMKEVGFDSIDIDWEYPEVSDANNYVKLLQDLRTALDTQSKKDNIHYYLTIAVGSGIDKISNLTKAQWQTVAAAVDYIDLMTYDFHGGWDKGNFPSDFMAAMNLDQDNDPAFNPSSPNPTLQKYDVVDAVNAYLDNGVAAKQLIMGIPLYGRLVNIANAGDSDGLYQTITDVPAGEYDDSSSGHTGVFDYKCIVNNNLCLAQGSTLSGLTFVDPTQNPYGKQAQTPWAYSQNLFLTYDDTASATHKAHWVKQHLLGGAMFWELSGDLPANDPRSLVNAVYQTFNSQK